MPVVYLFRTLLISGRLFTRKETAQILQVSLPTLHHYTKLGLIKSRRFGNAVRYSIDDINEAVSDRRFRKGGQHAA